MSLSFVFNVTSWIILVNKRQKNWQEPRYEKAKGSAVIFCAGAALVSLCWHIANANNISGSINVASNTLAGLLFWWVLYSNLRMYKRERYISKY